MKAPIDMISASESEDIFYPHSDGQPLAENTIQLEWILILFGNLRILFEDPLVFIAADLFWYPVKGDNKTRVAPDVMVAFGRPKGDRLSYKQWEEEGVSPQVVIEVLSPGNTPNEMIRKHLFYQKYGVEEYIILDPQKEEFFVYQRQGELLLPKDGELSNWQSPRLGMWLEKKDGELTASYPDKQPFLTHEELNRELKELNRELNQTKQIALEEKKRADRILQQSIQQLHKAGMSISEIAKIYAIAEEEVQKWIL